jgi:hypothetical protein
MKQPPDRGQIETELANLRKTYLLTHEEWCLVKIKALEDQLAELDREITKDVKRRRTPPRH